MFTPEKTSTVNCGETVRCATCIRWWSGTVIAVAYLEVDWSV